MKRIRWIASGGRTLPVEGSMVSILWDVSVEGYLEIKSIVTWT